MDKFLAFTYLFLGLFVAALNATDMGLRNLAKGKPATQSSIYAYGSASRAVDNNWNSNWNGKSCTHTQAEKNPWWQVDLGQAYTIYSVFLKNREDCCSERLAEVLVTVDGRECNTYNCIVGKYAMITCKTPLRGKKVKVQLLQAKQPLTLCEVNVLGH